MDIYPVESYVYNCWAQKQYLAIVVAGKALQATLLATPEHGKRTKEQKIQAFTQFTALMDAHAPFAPSNPNWMHSGYVLESYGDLAFFVADFYSLFVADYKDLSFLDGHTDAQYRLADVINTAQKLADYHKI